MEKNQILEILSDWNFWAREIDAGIRRDEYVGILAELLTKTDQVVALAGVRRSGKSTLIRQTAKELGGGLNTLIVNFEDERFLVRDLQLLSDIFDAYREKVKPKGKPFMFLDEVQNIPGWERFVRGVHERKEANIMVTGSSSKLLSAELATLLTGRHITYPVYPLSFKEFLFFRKIPVRGDLEALAKRLEIKGLLSEYMEYGGFPGVVLSSEKQRILLSYFEALINRDVIDRYKIREKEKLLVLAKYYLTNISSLASYNKTAKFLKLSPTTVERFTNQLENANIIFQIKKFDYSVKEQENSPRKIYSIDTGLSNAMGFRFTEKPGKNMENIVALELKRRQAVKPETEIYYWKDSQQRETDYVIKEGTKIKELIQVCYSVEDPETKERETKALLKSMDEFKKDQATIITLDHEGTEEIKNKKITYTPLWKWLLTTPDQS
ncbi:MAG: ATP-binding protein [Candidatus Altiarchaeia archaeon]